MVCAMDKVCPECGKEFTPPNKRQKYCSHICWRKGFHAQRIREVNEHIALCKTKSEMDARFPTDALFAKRHHLSAWGQLCKAKAIHKHKYSRKEILREAGRYETWAQFRRGNMAMCAAALRWHKNEISFKKGSELRIIWTDERIKEALSECASIKEFRRKHPGCYAKLYRDGRLAEWTKTYKRKKKKWSKEEVYEEGRRFRYKKDWERQSPGSYSAALKNGWMKELSHFENGRFGAKRPSLWTKEKCREVALTCLSSMEMQQKNIGAYASAVKHGFIREYTWFRNNPTHRYEECVEASKKYKTKTEFYKGDRNKFEEARRHGWLDSFVWMKDRNINPIRDNMECVYAYVWTRYKAVYVGLTIDPQRRDEEHRNPTRKATAVFTFHHDTGASIPKMRVLFTNLSQTEALEKEDEVVHYYKSLGWNVLNKAKTGKRSGSLGYYGFIKWTKQSLYDTARKYKTISAFRRFERSAYETAKKRGYLKEYPWLVQRAAI